MNKNKMVLVGDWYCWFCRNKITETVYVEEDPNSRRYGTPVYQTSWDTIHTARRYPEEESDYK